MQSPDAFQPSDVSNDAERSGSKLEKSSETKTVLEFIGCPE
jgi:hypothetical protein